MVNLTEKARQWPRGDNGQPIFRTTQEAIFYANLIADNNPMVDEINLYRRITRREIRILRGRPDPDYDILMELAVKGQLFRECMDEVKRINQEGL